MSYEKSDGERIDDLYKKVKEVEKLHETHKQVKKRREELRKEGNALLDERISQKQKELDTLRKQGNEKPVWRDARGEVVKKVRRNPRGDRLN